MSVERWCLTFVLRCLCGRVLGWAGRPAHCREDASSREEKCNHAPPALRTRHVPAPQIHLLRFTRTLRISSCWSCSLLAGPASFLGRYAFCSKFSNAIIGRKRVQHINTSEENFPKASFQNLIEAILSYVPITKCLLEKWHFCCVLWIMTWIMTHDLRITGLWCYSQNYLFWCQ